MSKAGLILTAILFALLGGLASYASGRIMCIMDSCILVTEGKGLEARGIRLDPGQAKLIQQSPMPLWV